MFEAVNRVPIMIGKHALRVCHAPLQLQPAPSMMHSNGENRLQMEVY